MMRYNVDGFELDCKNVLLIVKMTFFMFYMWHADWCYNQCFICGITRALNLGVNVKMITGDQLAIAKETGRMLGMGTNMYPSSSLLGQSKDAVVSALPVDELIEKADGFSRVFPEHKYEIVKRLQDRKHIYVE